MTTLRSIAFGVALVIVSLSAGAYESDFHFGLTWWLARQAGFTPQQGACASWAEGRQDRGDRHSSKCSQRGADDGGHAGLPDSEVQNADRPLKGVRWERNSTPRDHPLTLSDFLCPS